MQTLGVANSGAQSEGRLKTLFWPAIQNAADVDTLGSQGHWVCAIVAVFALVTSALLHQPTAGAALTLYYYLGGVGVREHSRFAAAMVFIMFAIDTIMAFGVLKLLLSALLLSNVRATWIASGWRAESPEAAMPMRFGETWGDKFADTLPRWLWPKIRIVYYIFSAAFLLLTIVGFAVLATRRHG